MVNFPIETGIRKIGDSILDKITKNTDVLWFDEPIAILLSSTKVLATIVVDFAFSNSAVIEYTLNGTDFIEFNQGLAVTGGQSRFIDVTTGNVVNFRSKTDGDLIRCIVSSVP